MIKFHYYMTEKINRKKSLHRASITSTPRPDHTEDINDCNHSAILLFTSISAYTTLKFKMIPSVELLRKVFV